MPVNLILGIAILLACIVIGRLARVWWKFRGARVITCPENLKHAGVVLSARHAAATGLMHAPELRLSSCTRWPERAGCGQQCLIQVAEAPAGCLVRNILAKWYEGKTCASCGCPLDEAHWEAAKPALLRAGKTSVEWSQIPAEELHEVLAASLPLCFACHMANTLVREHPELVVDRSAKRAI